MNPITLSNILYFIAWYITGLLILGYSVNYEMKRITPHLPLFLFGGIFGPTVIALFLFDKLTDENKK
jgi:hypothetical protein